VCRRLLGYLHSVKGVPLAELSLASIVPSAGREGVSVLMEYQHWRTAQRGTAARSQVMPIKAAIVLCRFLFHEQSQVGVVSGRRVVVRAHALQQRECVALPPYLTPPTRGLPPSPSLQPSTNLKQPYRDLLVMQELAAMLKVANKAANAAPLVSDEARKWMAWDDFQKFVRLLHAECAGGWVAMAACCCSWCCACHGLA
jgi:hypothetical protein